MARQRRRYRENQLYLLTNRVAVGLPFVPHRFMEYIFLGILAAAQSMYNTVICDFVLMGNHYHILVVCNPKTMAAFCNYLDGELARVINRLRGVTNQNVWASRVSAQPILDLEAAIQKVAYIYLNPQRACLCRSIDQYVGLSSHKLAQQGQSDAEWPLITSSMVERLNYGRLNDKLLADRFLSKSKAKHLLKLSPFAWKGCFKAAKDLSDDELHLRVRDAIQRGTEELDQKFGVHRRVKSASQLQIQCFYKPYQSKKYGPRPLCLASESERIKRYRKKYRLFCAKCRVAWIAWKRGDFTVPFPRGAFRPYVPILIT